jgi:hypothetical protein
MSQKRLIGCPLEWFTWAFGLTKSKEQFALALYLYRRACIVRGAMVTVPNRELTELGFGGRTSKRRLLLGLESAGVIRVEQRNGRAARVTLLRWP